MSYKVLYRKWRPLKFSEVSGQDQIVITLKNELINNRLSHAFLFCGTRGTGKTTVARILARAINCLDGDLLYTGEPCNKCQSCKSILESTTTDVIEIDAASNNRVDNVRELLDEVMYRPVSLKNRVYVIDEVHMLSSGAFNALLKTLEEPPENVFFILATTEPNKIPVTIQSRCQRFDFRRVSVPDITKKLKHITSSENIMIDDNSIKLISTLAKGSLRDALSLLEQVRSQFSGSDINTAKIESILGILDSQEITNLFRLILDKDIKNLILTISEIYMSGKDIFLIFNQMLSYCRDIILFKNGIAPEFIVNNKFRQQSEIFSTDLVLKFVDLIYEGLMLSRYNDNLNYVLESVVIKMSELIVNSQEDVSLEGVKVAAKCQPIVREKWLGILDEIQVTDNNLRNKLLSSRPFLINNTVYVDVPEPFINTINSSEMALLERRLANHCKITTHDELRELIKKNTNIDSEKGSSKINEIISQKDKMPGIIQVH